LAYKGIRSDWLDKYSGTIKNNIGATICFERNQVDDNRENECSFGLHVGTLAYVRGYCTERVIRVKVNPADCISVPRDHSAQKLRVCRYEILAEHNPEEILTSALYTSSGERSVPEYPDYDICVEDFYDNTEGSVCFVASTINEAPMRTKKRIFKRDRFGRFARTR
jgi:hypothetical protein